jgi:hypothetical protein
VEKTNDRRYRYGRHAVTMIFVTFAVVLGWGDHQTRNK